MTNIIVTKSEVKLGTYRADFHITALSDGSEFEHLHLVPPLGQSFQNPVFPPRLTFGNLDVQSCPDQSHQCGGEVDRHVLSHWHIHQDQSLCEREETKQQEEKKNTKRNLGEK